jgi:hypothetical protein
MGRIVFKTRWHGPSISFESLFPSSIAKLRSMDVRMGTTGVLKTRVGSHGGDEELPSKMHSSKVQYRESDATLLFFNKVFSAQVAKTCPFEGMYNFSFAQAEIASSTSFDALRDLIKFSADCGSITQLSCGPKT